MPLVNPGHSHDSPVQVGFLVPVLPGIGAPYLDIGTVVIGRTTLTYVEGGPYSDSATFAIVTSIPVGEIEFVHPTGWWGPFDDDDGQI